jgi:Gpi18-like mannosyltransferase
MITTEERTEERIETGVMPHQRPRRFDGRARAANLAEAWPPLLTFLIVKVFALLLGVFAYQIFTNKPVPNLRAAIAVWNGWDTPHYLNLAQYGYEATGERSVGIVFYPLFPWLIRAVGWPLGDYLVGAFIVANVASFVAVLLLYRLVRLDYDAAVARQSVWFLSIYPLSYFLHIGYTESLFLALALGAFLAARTGRWPLVGLLGALACLTRVNGLILLPALMLEATAQYRRTRRVEPRWTWLGLLPLGFGGFLLLNYRVTGDPFTFMRITREHWHKGLAAPWDGIRSMIISVSWRPPIDVISYVVQQTFFLAISAIGAAVAWFTLRPSYAIWIALNLLLITSTTFIYSLPRYSLIFFPLPILFALLARRPIWHSALTAASLMLMALLIVMFITMTGLAY